MKDVLKIGLVVADDMEYEDLTKLLGCELTVKNFFGRTGHEFKLIKDNKTIIVHSILCGIGTVNAATAAMYLVENGADILLNYGLSGGISEVGRGEDVVSLSFMEYDFDLTCCGYKMCEKPAQNYIYNADNRLVDIFLKSGEYKCGKFASGDRFVSDPVLKEKLKSKFGINCCDMETSAIASVADLTNTPFCAIRRVSDDAGEDATADYREMNLSNQSSLPSKLIDGINAVFYEESFWN